MHTLLLAAVLSLSVAQAGDEDAAARGKDTYTAKCSACHGAAGAGDGVAARALPRPPANMAESEFWTHMTDERLRATITKGKPGTAMRGFPVKEPQLTDLIAYLKTFAPAK